MFPAAYYEIRTSHTGRTGLLVRSFRSAPLLPRVVLLEHLRGSSQQRGPHVPVYIFPRYGIMPRGVLGLHFLTRHASEQIENQTSPGRLIFLHAGSGIEHIESRSSCPAFRLDQGLLTFNFQARSNPDSVSNHYSNLAMSALRRLPPGTCSSGIGFDASSLPVSW